MMERAKARGAPYLAARGVAAELLFALALGVAGCLSILLGAWVAEIL